VLSLLMSRGRGRGRGAGEIFLGFFSRAEKKRTINLSNQNRGFHALSRIALTCAGSAPVEERADGAAAPLARAEEWSAGGRLRRGEGRKEDDADAAAETPRKPRGGLDARRCFEEREALLGGGAGFEDALRVLCIQWRGSMAGPDGENRVDGGGKSGWLK